MSKDERDNALDKIIKAVEGHSLVLYGDNEKGIDGLVERQQADEAAKKMMVDELRSIKDSINDLRGDLMKQIIRDREDTLKEIAKVAVWKDGIQATPAKIVKRVGMVAAFIAASTAIVSFFWNFIEKGLAWFTGR